MQRAEAQLVAIQDGALLIDLSRSGSVGRVFHFEFRPWLGVGDGYF